MNKRLFKTVLTVGLFAVCVAVPDLIGVMLLAVLSVMAADMIADQWYKDEE